jgi:hypothetical protein
MVDNIMESFYRLAIDAGLVIFLMLSTIIGNIIVSIIWMEIVGLPIRLESLAFSLMGFSLFLIGVPSFSPLIATSYFGGNIAYNINHEFNYLDILFILIPCFIYIFIFMRGLGISEDLESLENSEFYRERGLTHRRWWGRIDESLSPAVIITLLIMSGLILSCYFNGSN